MKDIFRFSATTNWRLDYEDRYRRLYQQPCEVVLACFTRVTETWTDDEEKSRVYDTSDHRHVMGSNHSDLLSTVRAQET